MKILVTGYHGFVGQNLIPFLKEKGYVVYGLGRTGDYTWDDLDKDTFPQVDAIIHLAGKAHDTKNATEAKTYFDVNTRLTIKIFSYFIQHPEIKNFLFFSSVKAVADRISGDSLKEDAEYKPRGPYGESKAEAEKEIMKLTRSEENIDLMKGRSVYILRPCMMHGPGNKGNLNLLYRVISHNLPWPLGAFENKRSYAGIKNVCFVTEKLISQEIPSGIYNLADDEVLSTNQLVEVIFSTLGKKAHIWKFGKGLMAIVAKIGDKLHLPLNSERLNKLTENYVVDNQKIKNALHITKMPFSTREGLTYTILHFRD